MSKYRKLIVTTALAATLAAPVYAGTYGLGRPALPEEVAAWDLDVSPNGTGLPAGSGSVMDGEEIFADQCAVCHGDFAEGVGNWPKLAGGADTLDHEDPLKTVGSYWPYLSTTWDYVNRSMPFGNAQTLEVDEVYAIVAYILYSNDLVEEEFVLSQDNFLEVDMPNRDGFILDDRDKTEYSVFNDSCMSDCKASVEITMRALVLDVTPEETAAKGAAVEVAPVEQSVAEEVVIDDIVALDPELVAKGAKTFMKCKACHQVGEGAKNKTGPVLNGIVDASVGQVDGFKYSKPMIAAAEDGLVWTEEELSAFLTKPKTYMKGTRMSFSGLRKEKDIAAVIAYLRSFSQ
ncbi:MFS transporter [Rhodobacterales bacterium 56_14_T64]|nr:MFS transporter [Rhodobacterales bacterium 56_14_T64]